ncbi:uncharacterized protein LOC126815462 isoform X2 [Patella vulgata]|nr:uncharacterized protein LOC126815462 isoform X2 [Patella vulgata]
MIRKIIADMPAILTEEIQVPAVALGRIIGRGGENVRELSRISKAKIYIERTTEDHNKVGNRKVTITGSREQIDLAKNLIDEKIHEEEAFRAKKSVMEANREQRTSHRKDRTPEHDTHHISPAMLKDESWESTKAVMPEQKDYMEVYISAIEHPGHFWVQILSSEAMQLDRMTDEMNRFYSTDEAKLSYSISDISIGDMVAAPFESDNAWYRAKVIGIHEDKVDLYFVDFGDSEFVWRNQIRQLRPDFLSLKFQAVECKLANIKPTGENWSEAAIDFFEEITYCAQWKVLIAKTVTYESTASGMIPCLQLYDTNGDEDIDINEEMVSKKHGILDDLMTAGEEATASSLFEKHRESISDTDIFFRRPSIKHRESISDTDIFFRRPSIKHVDDKAFVPPAEKGWVTEYPWAWAYNDETPWQETVKKETEYQDKWLAQKDSFSPKDSPEGERTLAGAGTSNLLDYETMAISTAVTSSESNIDDQNQLTFRTEPDEESCLNNNMQLSTETLLIDDHKNIEILDNRMAEIIKTDEIVDNIQGRDIYSSKDILKRDSCDSEQLDTVSTDITISDDTGFNMSISEAEAYDQDHRRFSDMTTSQSSDMNISQSDTMSAGDVMSDGASENLEEIDYSDFPGMSFTDFNSPTKDFDLSFVSERDSGLDNTLNISEDFDRESMASTPNGQSTHLQSYLNQSVAFNQVESKLTGGFDSTSSSVLQVADTISTTTEEGTNISQDRSGIIFDASFYQRDQDMFPESQSLSNIQGTQNIIYQNICESKHESEGHNENKISDSNLSEIVSDNSDESPPIGVSYCVISDKDMNLNKRSVFSTCIDPNSNPTLSDSTGDHEIPNFSSVQPQETVLISEQQQLDLIMEQDQSNLITEQDHSKLVSEQDHSKSINEQEKSDFISESKKADLKMLQDKSNCEQKQSFVISEQVQSIMNIEHKPPNLISEQEHSKLISEQSMEESSVDPPSMSSDNDILTNLVFVDSCDSVPADNLNVQTSVDNTSNVNYSSYVIASKESSVDTEVVQQVSGRELHGRLSKGMEMSVDLCTQYSARKEMTSITSEILTESEIFQRTSVNQGISNSQHLTGESLVDIRTSSVDEGILHNLTSELSVDVLAGESSVDVQRNSTEEIQNLKGDSSVDVLASESPVDVQRSSADENTLQIQNLTGDSSVDVLASESSVDVQISSADENTLQIQNLTGDSSVDVLASESSVDVQISSADENTVQIQNLTSDSSVDVLTCESSVDVQTSSTDENTLQIQNLTGDSQFDVLTSESSVDVERSSADENTLQINNLAGDSSVDVLTSELSVDVQRSCVDEDTLQMQNLTGDSQFDVLTSESSVDVERSSADENTLQIHNLAGDSSVDVLTSESSVDVQRSCVDEDTLQIENLTGDSQFDVLTSESSVDVERSSADENTLQIHNLAGDSFVDVLTSESSVDVQRSCVDEDTLQMQNLTGVDVLTSESAVDVRTSSTDENTLQLQNLTGDSQFDVLTSESSVDVERSSADENTLQTPNLAGDSSVDDLASDSSVDVLTSESLVDVQRSCVDEDTLQMQNLTGVDVLTSESAVDVRTSSTDENTLQLQNLTGDSQFDVLTSESSVDVERSSADENTLQTPSLAGDSSVDVLASDSSVDVLTSESLVDVQRSCVDEDTLQMQNLTGVDVLTSESTVDAQRSPAVDVPTKHIESIFHLQTPNENTSHTSNDTGESSVNILTSSIHESSLQIQKLTSKSSLDVNEHILQTQNLMDDSSVDGSSMDESISLKRNETWESSIDVQRSAPAESILQTKNLIDESSAVDVKTSSADEINLQTPGLNEIGESSVDVQKSSMDEITSSKTPKTRESKVDVQKSYMDQNEMELSLELPVDAKQSVLDDNELQTRVVTRESPIDFIETDRAGGLVTEIQQDNWQRDEIILEDELSVQNLDYFNGNLDENTELHILVQGKSDTVLSYSIKSEVETIVPILVPCDVNDADIKSDFAELNIPLIEYVNEKYEKSSFEQCEAVMRFVIVEPVTIVVDEHYFDLFIQSQKEKSEKDCVSIELGTNIHYPASTEMLQSFLEIDSSPVTITDCRYYEASTMPLGQRSEINLTSHYKTLELSKSITQQKVFVESYNAELLYSQNYSQESSSKVNTCFSHHFETFSNIYQHEPNLQSDSLDCDAIEFKNQNSCEKIIIASEEIHQELMTRPNVDEGIQSQRSSLYSEDSTDYETESTDAGESVVTVIPCSTRPSSEYHHHQDKSVGDLHDFDQDEELSKFNIDDSLTEMQNQVLIGQEIITPTHSPSFEQQEELLAADGPKPLAQDGLLYYDFGDSDEPQQNAEDNMKFVDDNGDLQFVSKDEEKTESHEASSDGVSIDDLNQADTKLETINIATMGKEENEKAESRYDDQNLASHLSNLDDSQLIQKQLLETAIFSVPQVDTLLRNINVKQSELYEPKEDYPVNDLPMTDAHLQSSEDNTYRIATGEAAPQFSSQPGSSTVSEESQLIQQPQNNCSSLDNEQSQLSTSLDGASAQLYDQLSNVDDPQHGADLGEDGPKGLAQEGVLFSDFGDTDKPYHDLDENMKIVEVNGILQFVSTDSMFDGNKTELQDDISEDNIASNQSGNILSETYLDYKKFSEEQQTKVLTAHEVPCTDAQLELSGDITDSIRPGKMVSCFQSDESTLSEELIQPPNKKDSLVNDIPVTDTALESSEDITDKKLPNEISLEFRFESNDPTLSVEAQTIQSQDEKDAVIPMTDVPFKSSEDISDRKLPDGIASESDLQPGESTLSEKSQLFQQSPDTDLLTDEVAVTYATLESSEDLTGKQMSEKTASESDLQPDESTLSEKSQLIQQLSDTDLLTDEVAVTYATLESPEDLTDKQISDKTASEIGFQSNESTVLEESPLIEPSKEKDYLVDEDPLTDAPVELSENITDTKLPGEICDIAFESGLQSFESILYHESELIQQQTEKDSLVDIVSQTEETLESAKDTPDSKQSSEIVTEMSLQSGDKIMADLSVQQINDDTLLTELEDSNGPSTSEQEGLLYFDFGDSKEPETHTDGENMEIVEIDGVLTFVPKDSVVENSAVAGHEAHVTESSEDITDIERASELGLQSGESISSEELQQIQPPSEKDSLVDDMTVTDPALKSSEDITGKNLPGEISPGFCFESNDLRISVEAQLIQAPSENNSLVDIPVTDTPLESSEDITDKKPSDEVSPKFRFDSDSTLLVEAQSIQQTDEKDAVMSKTDGPFKSSEDISNRKLPDGIASESDLQPDESTLSEKSQFQQSPETDLLTNEVKSTEDLTDEQISDKTASEIGFHSNESIVLEESLLIEPSKEKDYLVDEAPLTVAPLESSEDITDTKLSGDIAFESVLHSFESTLSRESQLIQQPTEKDSLVDIVSQTEETLESAKDTPDSKQSSEIVTEMSLQSGDKIMANVSVQQIKNDTLLTEPEDSNGPSTSEQEGLLYFDFGDSKEPKTHTDDENMEIVEIDGVLTFVPKDSIVKNSVVAVHEAHMTDGQLESYEDITDTKLPYKSASEPGLQSGESIPSEESQQIQPPSEKDSLVDDVTVTDTALKSSEDITDKKLIGEISPGFCLKSNYLTISGEAQLIQASSENNSLVDIPVTDTPLESSEDITDKNPFGKISPEFRFDSDDSTLSVEAQTIQPPDEIDAVIPKTDVPFKSSEAISDRKLSDRNASEFDLQPDESTLSEKSQFQQSPETDLLTNEVKSTEDLTDEQISDKTASEIGFHSNESTVLEESLLIEPSKEKDYLVDEAPLTDAPLESSEDITDTKLSGDIAFESVLNSFESTLSRESQLIQQPTEKDSLVDIVSQTEETLESAKDTPDSKQSSEIVTEMSLQSGDKIMANVSVQQIKDDTLSTEPEDSNGPSTSEQEGLLYFDFGDSKGPKTHTDDENMEIVEVDGVLTFVPKDSIVKNSTVAGHEAHMTDGQLESSEDITDRKLNYERTSELGLQSGESISSDESWQIQPPSDKDSLVDEVTVTHTALKLSEDITDKKLPGEISPGFCFESNDLTISVEAQLIQASSENNSLVDIPVTDTPLESSEDKKPSDEISPEFRFDSNDSTLSVEAQTVQSPNEIDSVIPKTDVPFKSSGDISDRKLPNRNTSEFDLQPDESTLSEKSQFQQSPDTDSLTNEVAVGDATVQSTKDLTDKQIPTKNVSEIGFQSNESTVLEESLLIKPSKEKDYLVDEVPLTDAPLESSEDITDIKLSGQIRDIAFESGLHSFESTLSCESQLIQQRTGKDCLVDPVSLAEEPLESAKDTTDSKQSGEIVTELSIKSGDKIMANVSVQQIKDDALLTEPEYSNGPSTSEQEGLLYFDFGDSKESKRHTNDENMEIVEIDGVLTFVPKDSIVKNSVVASHEAHMTDGQLESYKDITDTKLPYESAFEFGLQSGESISSYESQLIQPPSEKDSLVDDVPVTDTAIESSEDITDEKLHGEISPGISFESNLTISVESQLIQGPGEQDYLVDDDVPLELSEDTTESIQQLQENEYTELKTHEQELQDTHIAEPEDSGPTVSGQEGMLYFDFGDSENQPMHTDDTNLEIVEIDGVLTFVQKDSFVKNSEVPVTSIQLESSEYITDRKPVGEIESEVHLESSGSTTSISEESKPIQQSQEIYSANDDTLKSDAQLHPFEERVEPGKIDLFGLQEEKSVKEYLDALLLKASSPFAKPGEITVKEYLDEQIKPPIVQTEQLDENLIGITSELSSCIDLLQREMEVVNPGQMSEVLPISEHVASISKDISELNAVLKANNKLENESTDSIELLSYKKLQNYTYVSTDSVELLSNQKTMKNEMQSESTIGSFRSPGMSYRELVQETLEGETKPEQDSLCRLAGDTNIVEQKVSDQVFGLAYDDFYNKVQTDQTPFSIFIPTYDGVFQPEAKVLSGEISHENYASKSDYSINPAEDPAEDVINESTLYVDEWLDGCQDAEPVSYSSDPVESQKEVKSEIEEIDEQIAAADDDDDYDDYVIKLIYIPDEERSDMGSEQISDDHIVPECSLASKNKAETEFQTLIDGLTEIKNMPLSSRTYEFSPKSLSDLAEEVVQNDFFKIGAPCQSNFSSVSDRNQHLALQDFQNIDMSEDSTNHFCTKTDKKEKIIVSKLDPVKQDLFDKFEELYVLEADDSTVDPESQDVELGEAQLDESSLDSYQGSLESLYVTAEEMTPSEGDKSSLGKDTEGDSFDEDLDSEADQVTLGTEENTLQVDGNNTVNSDNCTDTDIEDEEYDQLDSEDEVVMERPLPNESQNSHDLLKDPNLKEIQTNPEEHLFRKVDETKEIYLDNLGDLSAEVDLDDSLEHLKPLEDLLKAHHLEDPEVTLLRQIYNDGTTSKPMVAQETTLGGEHMISEVSFGLEEKSKDTVPFGETTDYSLGLDNAQPKLSEKYMTNENVEDDDSNERTVDLLSQYILPHETDLTQEFKDALTKQIEDVEQCPDTEMAEIIAAQGLATILEEEEELESSQVSRSRRTKKEGGQEMEANLERHLLERTHLEEEIVHLMNEILSVVSAKVTKDDERAEATKLAEEIEEITHQMKYRRQMVEMIAEEIGEYPDELVKISEDHDNAIEEAQNIKKAIEQINESHSTVKHEPSLTAFGKVDVKEVKHFAPFFTNEASEHKELSSRYDDLQNLDDLADDDEENYMSEKLRDPSDFDNPKAISITEIGEGSQLQPEKNISNQNQMVAVSTDKLIVRDESLQKLQESDASLIFTEVQSLQTDETTSEMMDRDRVISHYEGLIEPDQALLYKLETLYFIDNMEDNMKVDEDVDKESFTQEFKAMQVPLRTRTEKDFNVKHFDEHEKRKEENEPLHLIIESNPVEKSDVSINITGTETPDVEPLAAEDKHLNIVSFDVPATISEEITRGVVKPSIGRQISELSLEIGKSTKSDTRHQDVQNRDIVQNDSEFNRLEQENKQKQHFTSSSAVLIENFEISNLTPSPLPTKTTEHNIFLNMAVVEIPSTDECSISVTHSDMDDIVFGIETESECDRGKTETGHSGESELDTEQPSFDRVPWSSRKDLYGYKDPSRVYKSEFTKEIKQSAAEQELQLHMQSVEQATELQLKRGYMKGQVYQCMQKADIIEDELEVQLETDAMEQPEVNLKTDVIGEEPELSFKTDVRDGEPEIQLMTSMKEHPELQLKTDLTGEAAIELKVDTIKRESEIQLTTDIKEKDPDIQLKIDIEREPAFKLKSNIEVKPENRLKIVEEGKPEIQLKSDIVDGESVNHLKTDTKREPNTQLKSDIIDGESENLLMSGIEGEPDIELKSDIVDAELENQLKTDIEGEPEMQLKIDGQSETSLQGRQLFEQKIQSKTDIMQVESDFVLKTDAVEMEPDTLLKTDAIEGKPEIQLKSDIVEKDPKIQLKTDPIWEAIEFHPNTKEEQEPQHEIVDVTQREQELELLIDTAELKLKMDTTGEEPMIPLRTENAPGLKIDTAKGEPEFQLKLYTTKGDQKRQLTIDGDQEWSPEINIRMGAKDSELKLATYVLEEDQDLQQNVDTTKHDFQQTSDTSGAEQYDESPISSDRTLDIKQTVSSTEEGLNFQDICLEQAQMVSTKRLEEMTHLQTDVQDKDVSTKMHDNQYTKGTSLEGLKTFSIANVQREENTSVEEHEYLSAEIQHMQSLEFSEDEDFIRSVKDEITIDVYSSEKSKFLNEKHSGEETKHEEIYDSVACETLPDDQYASELEISAMDNSGEILKELTLSESDSVELEVERLCNQMPAPPRENRGETPQEIMTRILMETEDILNSSSQIDTKHDSSHDDIAYITGAVNMLDDNYSENGFNKFTPESTPFLDGKQDVIAMDSLSEGGCHGKDTQSEGQSNVSEEILQSGVLEKCIIESLRSTESIYYSTVETTSSSDMVDQELNKRDEATPIMDFSGYISEVMYQSALTTDSREQMESNTSDDALDRELKTLESEIKRKKEEIEIQSTTSQGIAFSKFSSDEFVAPQVFSASIDSDVPYGASALAGYSSQEEEDIDFEAAEAWAEHSNEANFLEETRGTRQYTESQPILKAKQFDSNVPDIVITASTPGDDYLHSWGFLSEDNLDSEVVQYSQYAEDDDGIPADRDLRKQFSEFLDESDEDSDLDRHQIGLSQIHTEAQGQELDLDQLVGRLNLHQIQPGEGDGPSEEEHLSRLAQQFDLLTPPDSVSSESDSASLDAEYEMVHVNDTDDDLKDDAHIDDDWVLTDRQDEGPKGTETAACMDEEMKTSIDQKQESYTEEQGQISETGTSEIQEATVKKNRLPSLYQRTMSAALSGVTDKPDWQIDMASVVLEGDFVPDDDDNVFINDTDPGDEGTCKKSDDESTPKSESSLISLTNPFSALYSDSTDTASECDSERRSTLEASISQERKRQLQVGQKSSIRKPDDVDSTSKKKKKKKVKKTTEEQPPRPSLPPLELPGNGVLLKKSRSPSLEKKVETFKLGIGLEQELDETLKKLETKKRKKKKKKGKEISASSQLNSESTNTKTTPSAKPVIVVTDVNIKTKKKKAEKVTDTGSDRWTTSEPDGVGSVYSLGATADMSPISPASEPESLSLPNTKSKTRRSRSPKVTEYPGTSKEQHKISREVKMATLDPGVRRSRTRSQHSHSSSRSPRRRRSNVVVVDNVQNF